MVIAFVGAKGVPYQSTQDRKEYHLELITKQLVERNHQVYVLSDPSYTTFTRYQQITLIPTMRNIWVQMKTLRSIPNLDIVHILSLHDAWLAFWISIFMPQVRIVFECYDYTFNPSSLTERQHTYLKAYIARTFAHEIIVDREDLYEFFAQTNLNTNLIRRSLDIHPTNRNESIKHWKLTRRQYLLVDSYRYRDQKNLKLIIEAYRKLSLPYPLVIIGSVSPYLKSRYIESRIIFAGRVSGQTERELITNARLFIDSSAMKEDKMALHLALAHGTPTLTEQHINHDALIGKNGLYYIKGNLSSIMNMIKFMEHVYPIMSKRALDYAKASRDMFAKQGQLNRYLYLYVNSYQKVRAFQEFSAETHISIPIQ